MTPVMTINTMPRKISLSSKRSFLKTKDPVVFKGK